MTSNYTSFGIGYTSNYIRRQTIIGIERSNNVDEIVVTIHSRRRYVTLFSFSRTHSSDQNPFDENRYAIVIHIHIYIYRDALVKKLQLVVYLERDR